MSISRASAGPSFVTRMLKRVKRPSPTTSRVSCGGSGRLAAHPHNVAETSHATPARTVKLAFVVRSGARGTKT
jgi:hypothetical protein